MSPELQRAVNAVTQELSPLPEGYYVEGDEASGSVLVCCKYPEPDGLGFAISAKSIAEGGYVEKAAEAFADLMKAVEAGAAEPAAGVEGQAVGG